MGRITICISLILLSLGFKVNAQCTGADLPADRFIGEYFIYDITTDVLDISPFNFMGEPTLVTLVSEVTGPDQTVPDQVLPINFRSFDAHYLPDLELTLPPITWAIQFKTGSCGVTFEDWGAIDHDTGLSCGGGPPLTIGPADGGAFKDFDESNFLLDYTGNVTGTCDEGPRIVELLFEKKTLNAPEFNMKGFTYYTGLDGRLHVVSEHGPIKEMRIYNMSGQRVINQTFNTTNVSADVVELSTGIYLVQAKTSEATASFKIFIR